MKLLLDDGDEHIGRDGAPDLCLHRVLARAQKTLDAQVLLDPLEEQFDLPATLVERGNRQRWQHRDVGHPLSQTTCRATIIADDPRRSAKNEKKSTLN